jgi:hypothetical protein
MSLAWAISQSALMMLPVVWGGAEAKNDGGHRSAAQNRQNVAAAFWA